MDNTLIHHGIKGQRWGVRRFQNKDGTLKNIEKRKNKNVSNDGARNVKNKKIASDKSKKTTDTKNNNNEELVGTGKRYAAILLGSVVGQVTANVLMSGTDMEASSGAMFVGRMVGGVWGATVADVLVGGSDKEE